MKLKNINASFFLLLIFSFLAVSINAQAKKSPVFIRFKLENPQLEKVQVTITGHIHKSLWRFPQKKTEVSRDDWSEWVNLSDWNWHSKLKRSGGVAEYPSLRLIAQNKYSKNTLSNCVFRVQLADAPSRRSIVINFTEKTESDSILFLAPYPLRENAKDFETASQMIERQYQWAKEAVNGKPIRLNKFEVTTNLWSMRNPALRRKSTELLSILGFNVIKGAELSSLEKFGLKTYQKSWLYNPEPEYVSKRWKLNIRSHKTKPEYNKIAFWELADEISVLNFKRIEPAKLDGWFNDYLKQIGFNDGNQNIKYPTKEIYGAELPTDVSLQRRKILYHAAKFGQWWSGKQLKQINDLILDENPNARTSTLLPSHGFMGNAWGPSKIGMSYGMLDIFRLADQKPIKQFGVEDWFGLNHMYGANYTWTGGQTFAYYNALIRSAIGDKPIKMMGLLTPSDDKYLRLKAYSALGQGAKSFYFWSYGPTYVSTENYWSDLKSMYFGIAKLNRSLQKAENILVPAKTVSDNDVGILYSSSHDIWNNRKQAAFVEKRLLWHALRHLHIQPNFLGENDIENGKLKNLKVLYIVDWNITRKASAKIDKWVKNGGILYMSAGAATRDEFNTPYTPNFSKKVWVNNPTKNSFYRNASFNERNSLPGLHVLTKVGVRLNNKSFELPVIGMYLGLKAKNIQRFARFKNGQTAGIITNYGKGKIIATGFLPMLAYGQLANFKPTTLEEKWNPNPREIIKKPLDLARINPIIKSNVPVVETSLLEGKEGSAIVLANYTYKPIKTLRLDVKLTKPVKKATSVKGKRVRIINQSKGSITLEVPLDWTDIILLK